MWAVRQRLLLPHLAKLAACMCMDPECCRPLQVTGDAWDTRPQLKVRVLKLMFGFSARDSERLLSSSRGLGSGGVEHSRVAVTRQSRQADEWGRVRGSGGTHQLKLPAEFTQTQAPTCAAAHCGLCSGGLHRLPDIYLSTCCQCLLHPAQLPLCCSAALAGEARLQPQRLQGRSTAGVMQSTSWGRCLVPACCPCSSWP